MKKEKIELFNGWMTDNIHPCDWSKPKRWKNYLAKVSMGADGKEEKEFMQISKEYDLFFNVADIKVNDILLASCWDDRKSRQYKQYYVVIGKSDEEIALCNEFDEIDFTTYRKAYKGLQEIKKLKNKEETGHNDGTNE